MEIKSKNYFFQEIEEGDQDWKKNDVWHREDGPAIIVFGLAGFCSLGWYQEGQRIKIICDGEEV